MPVCFSDPDSWLTVKAPESVLPPLIYFLSPQVVIFLRGSFRPVRRFLRPGIDFSHRRGNPRGYIFPNHKRISLRGIYDLRLTVRLKEKSTVSDCNNSFRILHAVSWNWASIRGVSSVFNLIRILSEGRISSCPSFLSEQSFGVAEGPETCVPRWKRTKLPHFSSPEIEMMFNMNIALSEGAIMPTRTFR